MSHAARETSPWIRRFHPAPAAVNRLVCFPHAGGSAPYFFPVSRSLTPDIDVLAVQYPGRQDRRAEACMDSIPQLADAIATELGGWTDKPLTFFGHSMGATLAFEVAHRMSGSPVLGIIASGRRAPSCPSVDNIHLRDDDGLMAELRELSGTDAALLGDEELMRMVLPAIRGDYRAVETYRYVPGTVLNCPILAMTGDADARVSIEEARLWGEHTTGEFVLQVYPGGHFYLNEQAPAVIAAVAGQVSAWSANQVAA